VNRDELGTWARRRIDEARSAYPALVADEGRAFMVWGTIGICGYITVEGDIYVEEDTWDPDPGSFAIRRDERARRQVLFFASGQYPELAACLPVRSAQDATCADCSGTGGRNLEGHTSFCSLCGGLGWVTAK
jgi:hypothetical protein